MDAIAATPSATGISGALPKSSSSTSLASASSSSKDASTSPTLCEQTEAAADDAKSPISIHSREIALLDLSPDELDIPEALGNRSPASIECLRINRCRVNGKIFSALVDALCAYELPRLHTVDISQNRVGGAQA
ncbi:hypothetical protein H4S02_009512, partial [Coemansia sp. RSA 2611]